MNEEKTKKLFPEFALLIKLLSAVIHAEEYINDGHNSFDERSFRAIMEQEDVKEYLKKLQKFALIPEKRTKR